MRLAIPSYDTHQRRGLGKVNHQSAADNPAAAALYASVGFRDAYGYLDASKPVTSVLATVHI